jgi:eukaryotic-like serine/threonine-protein kinase
LIWSKSTTQTSVFNGVTLEGGVKSKDVQKGPHIDKPQIAFLSNTGRDFQLITRDANSYDSLTVSADGRSLVAVQWKSSYSFYALSGSGSTSQIIHPALSQANHFNQFAWTDDGDLITTDGARVWRIGHGGRNESQLVGDETSRIRNVVACGSHILISWEYREGTGATNIWRINADGSEEVKMTDGQNDRGPVCSPDLKWVYYYAGNTISRVMMNGSGKPEEVPGSTPTPGSPFYIFINPMTISPDGVTLAFAWKNSKPPGEFKLALLNLKSSGPPRLFDVSPNFATRIRFTPDGKSVAHKISTNGAENVWVQPVNGSPGHQITNFLSGSITEFRWSPDSETLGILRAKSESDVVLLQETRQ